METTQIGRAYGCPGRDLNPGLGLSPTREGASREAHILDRTRRPVGVAGAPRLPDVRGVPYTLRNF